MGCDGAATARSARQLGIELRGESLLELRQALFHCEDLFDRIPIGQGPSLPHRRRERSFLIVQDDTRHFSLHALVDSGRGHAPAVRAVAGMPIDYETLYIGRWTQRLMLADRYRDGRVFLAGDAAHLVIPTGGLGMNTGAGDAVDLAWKLAGTLQRLGRPGLLDSYEEERAPIGARNVAASRKATNGPATLAGRVAARDRRRHARRANVARRRLAGVADREQRWSNDLLGIELGYRTVTRRSSSTRPGAGPDPTASPTSRRRGRVAACRTSGWRTGHPYTITWAAASRCCSPTARGKPEASLRLLPSWGYPSRPSPSTHRRQRGSSRVTPLPSFARTSMSPGAETRLRRTPATWRRG